MYSSENLGARFVATFGEWTTLLNFLRKKIFDKGLKTPQIWLSLEDKEIEGEWKDFYDGRTLLNFTPPWIGSKPDGDRKENCVRTADTSIAGATETALSLGFMDAAPTLKLICSSGTEICHDNI